MASIVPSTNTDCCWEGKPFVSGVLSPGLWPKPSLSPWPCTSKVRTSYPARARIWASHWYMASVAWIDPVVITMPGFRPVPSLPHTWPDSLAPVRARNSTRRDGMALYASGSPTDPPGIHWPSPVWMRPLLTSASWMPRAARYDWAVASPAASCHSGRVRSARWRPELRVTLSRSCWA